MEVLILLSRCEQDILRTYSQLVSLEQLQLPPVQVLIDTEVLNTASQGVNMVTQQFGLVVVVVVVQTDKHIDLDR